VPTVLEVHGKGAKDRVVPISERLAAILDEWGEVTGRKGLIAHSLGMAQNLDQSLSAVSVFRIGRKHGKTIGVDNLLRDLLVLLFLLLIYGNIEYRAS